MVFLSNILAELVGSDGPQDVTHPDVVYQANLHSRHISSSFFLARTSFADIPEISFENRMPVDEDGKLTCCSGKASGKLFYDCAPVCENDRRFNPNAMRNEPKRKTKLQPPTEPGIRGKVAENDDEDSPTAGEEEDDNVYDGKIKPGVIDKSIENNHALVGHPSKLAIRMGRDSSGIGPDGTPYDAMNGRRRTLGSKRWDKLTDEEREDMLYGRKPPRESEMGYVDFQGSVRLPAYDPKLGTQHPKPAFGWFGYPARSPGFVNIGDGNWNDGKFIRNAKAQKDQEQGQDEASVARTTDSEGNPTQQA